MSLGHNFEGNLNIDPPPTMMIPQNLFEYVLHYFEFFYNVKAMLESSRLEDLNRALSLVFALFHMDLEHITLSLLFHTLPRLLQTTRYHSLLTDPRGNTLAKLSVMILVSAQNSKNAEKGKLLSYTRGVIAYS